MSKQTIIKGTLILTIAGIATKLLGFYNRIFLTRVIGVKELGIYQLIFPVYILALSFCCQGIATTITKQVSYYIGKKDNLSAKKAFKLALFSSLTLGIFSYVIIVYFSEFICGNLLKNSDCVFLVKIIAIAIPFVSVKSCITAYLTGMDKPQYQGLSHFLEQIVRIGTGYILSIYWSAEKINATLAVTALVTGEIFAFVLSIFFYCFESRKKERTFITNKQKSKDKIFVLFCKDAVPITSTNLLLTMFSSLEAIMLPAMLYKFYGEGNVALEMYGTITGIVIPFLLFPSTITTALSTMMLPAVSYAKARHRNKTINDAVTKSISFCFILGVITCIGYIFLGEWACRFAFGSKEAGFLLEKMCYLCPFIYISGNMSAILNGLGKTFHNMMFNIVSISIRIIFTLTLVPVYGVGAYVLGMCASYMLLDMLMLFAIKRNIKI